MKDTNGMELEEGQLVRCVGEWGYFKIKHLDNKGMVFLEQYQSGEEAFDKGTIHRVQTFADKITVYLSKDGVSVNASR